ncbi:putative oxidoreductase [Poronia punctata]|nr:putative oxidoreductase [Poronia punctata]
MGSTISRLVYAFNPPGVPKAEGERVLRFGILGAADIAPLALVVPAKCHPEVVVQAIAARDRRRAEAFAKKHGIPDVKDTYQDVIDDPNIDCIFIPLANSLHLEWSIRAIRAGKHVLLEKPSVTNATEAEILFNLPELAMDSPNAPVLLEAFHNRFHPAWALFLSLIQPEHVAHVATRSMISWWYTSEKDIYFNYALGGGTIMQMGTYNFALLRAVFNTPPEECLSCQVTPTKFGVENADKIDDAFRAKFRFPNGGIGEAESTLRGPTIWTPSSATVTHREVVVVPNEKLPDSQQLFRTREVTFHGFVQAVIWHRIDVKDTFRIRKTDDGSVVKTWTEKSSRTSYSFREAGGVFSDRPGESFWMSYRYQLEQFVNRVKGRDTQYWVDPEDSIQQMKMIDLAYEKSGLGKRMTGSYKPTVNSLGET